MPPKNDINENSLDYKIGALDTKLIGLTELLNEIKTEMKSCYVSKTEIEGIKRTINWVLGTASFLVTFFSGIVYFVLTNNI